MKKNNDNLKGKKVLVTGGAGFIGSHLVERLLLEKAEMAIIARKNTKLWKINGFMNRIKIFNADIRDKEELEKIIYSFKPDYVFHLAAYGVNSKNKEYYKAIDINIKGAVNLLNPLIKIGCEKIINIGSSSEYGIIKEAQLEEGSLNPLNIYGSTKAAATIIMHQIARENDLGIITIRPFGLFGEKEETHKIFSYIISSLLKKEEVKLSSCKQFRDYIYVENLIDALILASKSDFKNEIFNIGSGNVKELRYYVEKIFDLIETGYKPNYGYYTQREGDMWAPCPNVDKIKKMLKWDVRIPFEIGLEKTIKWFKTNIEYY